MKADWKAGQIGDVCTVIAGQSPKGSAYNEQGLGLPFYQGKKEFADRYLGPPTTWTKSVTKKAEAGDILMSVRAPVGPINEATEAICIGRGLAAIRPGDRLNRDYLWYALLWLQPEIKGNAGAVFESINKAGIEKLEIPLPPLKEQQRIVAVLDEAFDGLARARAHAEANLQNARELFERSAEITFEESAANDNPQTFLVEELALPEKGSIRTGPFGSQLKHSEFVDEGISVLGIDNAVQNEFRWGKARFISEEKYEGLRRYTVKPRDVIITIMGTCGRCAIIPDDIPVAVNTKHLCCISLDQSKCLPEFLHRYFLHSPQGREYLSAQASGSVMDGLNMGIIKAMPVDVPPLEKQQSIADKLAEIDEHTRQLAEYYKSKVQDLGHLRQSLLQKAFAGELT